MLSTQQDYFLVCIGLFSCEQHLTWEGWLSLDTCKRLHFTIYENYPICVLNLTACEEMDRTSMLPITLTKLTHNFLSFLVQVLFADLSIVKKKQFASRTYCRVNFMKPLKFTQIRNRRSDDTRTCCPDPNVV